MYISCDCEWTSGVGKMHYRKWVFTRCFLTSRPPQRFACWTIDNRRLNIDPTHTSVKSLAVQWPVKGREKADWEHGSVYHPRVRLHVSPVSRGCGIHAAFPFFFPWASTSPIFSSSFFSSCTVMTNMSRRQCFTPPASGGKPEHSPQSVWITRHISMTMLDCPQALSLSREKNVAEETEYLASASPACCCTVVTSWLYLVRASCQRCASESVQNYCFLITPNCISFSFPQDPLLDSIPFKLASNLSKRSLAS